MPDKRDPIQAAQRAMRPLLPKRFYKAASAGEAEGGFTVLLDGRPMKTPAKRPFIVPSRALAEIAAGEWEAQDGEINPGSMPMTRLANLAIDRVTEIADEMRQEVLRYAGSDLVLYRVTEPEGLVAEQARHWNPVVAWARDQLDANFLLAEGVRFVGQPDSALQAVKKEIGRYAPPFALAALASATQLAGSALIALMLGRGALSPDAAWAAAHVDEDWNIREWGEDAEAMRQRAARRPEFDAAAEMLRLVR